MSDEKIDLEAFAKKVAEETAATIAMKQAEQKAAAEAEAEKAAEAAAQKEAAEAETKQAIRVGVETGAERLVEDLRKEMEENSADTAEVLDRYKKELQEKAEELEAMRNSKRDFSGRKVGDLKAHGKDLLAAHVLGKITRKGWDTDYAQEVLQKAEITYPERSGSGRPAR